MDESLRQELISLKDLDVGMRTRLLKRGALYEGYAQAMEQRHIDNARRLEQVVDEFGWPGVSLVGEDGAQAAWMIAQHAISLPELQKKLLQHLQVAVAAGEAKPLQGIYLQDRILFNEGKPQLYGMIFDWDDNGQLSTRVDDVAKANQRRRELGLVAIEEATVQHRRELVAEGGKPPGDLQAHKRRACEWARKVGWRDEECV